MTTIQGSPNRILMKDGGMTFMQNTYYEYKRKQTAGKRNVQMLEKFEAEIYGLIFKYLEDSAGNLHYPCDTSGRIPVDIAVQTLTPVVTRGDSLLAQQGLLFKVVTITLDGAGDATTEILAAQATVKYRVLWVAVSTEGAAGGLHVVQTADVVPIVCGAFTAAQAAGDSHGAPSYAVSTAVNKALNSVVTGGKANGVGSAAVLYREE